MKFINNQSNQSRIMQNKIKILKCLLLVPPFFPDLTTFSDFLPSLPQRQSRLWDCCFGQIIIIIFIIFSATFTCLMRERTLPLFQLGLPPMGECSMNFPHVSPSCGLQFSTNYSSVGPFQGLSPLGTACACMNPLRGHKSCFKTCFSTGASLHESIDPAISLL